MKTGVNLLFNFFDFEDQLIIFRPPRIYAWNLQFKLNYADFLLELLWLFFFGKMGSISITIMIQTMLSGPLVIYKSQCLPSLIIMTFFGMMGSISITTTSQSMLSRPLVIYKGSCRSLINTTLILTVGFKYITFYEQVTRSYQLNQFMLSNYHDHAYGISYAYDIFFNSSIFK